MIVCDLQCSFYFNQIESVHTLFDCPFFGFSWSLAFKKPFLFGLFSNLRDRWIFSHHELSLNHILWEWSFYWHLWLFRNNVLFQNQWPDPYNLVKRWKSTFSQIRASTWDLVKFPTFGGKIRDPFFLLFDVCVVVGEIPNLTNGLFILNNNIQLCWTDFSPVLRTSSEKTMAFIFQGVQIVDALQLHQLFIASPLTICGDLFITPFPCFSFYVCLYS